MWAQVLLLTMLLLLMLLLLLMQSDTEAARCLFGHYCARDFKL